MGGARVMSNLGATYRGVLIAAGTFLPAACVFYLRTFVDAELRFSSHTAHEIAIATATIHTTLVTLAAVSNYWRSLRAFDRRLVQSLVVFTLFYAVHGILTAESAHSMSLFVVFGPASRLLMASYFFLALVAHQRSDEVDAQGSGGKWLLHSIVLSALVMAILLTGREIAPWMLRALEIGALLAWLISAGFLLSRRKRPDHWVFLLVALLVFAQASMAFLLASPWNHLWWFAHGVFAGGFLLFSYPTISAYTRRSRATGRMFSHPTEAGTTRAVRYTLFLVGATQFLMAIAFFFRLPFAVRLWPFPGTTPLTFMFIASIFAAAAASTLWAVATKNYGALAGIGLDYVMILLPVSILSFQLGASSGNSQMTGYGVVCVVGALFGLGLVLWSIRIPIDRTLPMPRLVRWSFVVFIAALLIVSTQLILKVPDVIPWAITPDLSVVIGSMFLGAALYFVYALIRPSWLNAAGQLAGFLAYDVVLIVPFIKRLPTVAPQHQPGLIVYTAVVTYSGLLAFYYLFIHKPTRLWARES